MLIAGSESELQALLDTVAEESSKMGLELNAKKTECMVISKKGQIPTCNSSCKGEKIKQTHQYKYLGFLITSDARCDIEIKKRIAIAKEAFNRMNPILKNRNISMSTKMRTLKTYVWSVLLYGCECWTISANIKKKLEATEMWF